jgi:hypothetical protein
MPFLEFECPLGHVTEKFFKSISKGESVKRVLCEDCYVWKHGEKPEYGAVALDMVDGDPNEYPWNETWAVKVMSRPLGFGLYGDPAGYDKPSATKRFNTKTVSRKEGNASSVG